MTRTPFFVALLLAGVASAGPARADLVPMARDQVTVGGAEIRLGDLFQNVGEAAQRVVGAAPAAGSRMIYDAGQLAAIAAANGVAWSPTGRLDRVIVEREARSVGASEIERRLGEAVAAQGGEFAVELETRMPPVSLPLGEDYRLSFDDLRLDEAGRRVTATLVVPTGDGRSRSAIAGRLYPLVDVPVLRAPVMPGQAIAAADIDWIKTRADKLRRGTITDLGYLVGMTPRRPIAAGAPIDMREVQERVVVTKNSLVTVVFRTGSLTLTTQGKALENGAEGGAVRVLNQRSNRTIEATVVAPDLVEVKPAQMLARGFGSNR